MTTRKGKGLLFGLGVGVNLLLVVVGIGTADTNVSGAIGSDTTWTTAGSPYIVTGNVLVSSGITLTIEPGVTVKFNSGTALQIDGTLIARGTSGNKIIFTSNLVPQAPGDWGYILLTDSSVDATYDTNWNYTGGSILEHCIVEYAGGAMIIPPMNGAVRMENAHPFINHSLIRNNAARGIYGFNLSGNLRITNSSIDTNRGGISIQSQSGEVTIYNNIISNNNLSAFHGGGIALFSTASTGAGIVSKNVIKDNGGSGGGGIYVQGIFTISENIIIGNYGQGIGAGLAEFISKNILCGNMTVGFGGAIEITQGATVSGNSVIRNSSDGVIHCESASILTQNTITGNQNISGPITSAIIFANQSASLNFNNIFGNTATYELRNSSNQGQPNLNAENNWWGTAVESEIQARIYDWFDDSTKGFVDYNPWNTAIRTDAPISPPTGFTATIDTTSITLNWVANPEADVSGYKVYYDRNSGYPYANVVDVGNVTNYMINGVTPGTYYVAVTAYDSSYNPATDDPNTIVNENQTNGNESWFSEEGVVSNLVLYDDFAGTYIDKTKWRAGELVREIVNGRLASKLASPNTSAVSIFPYVEYNRLAFLDPNSVNSIQADVSLLDDVIINSARTRARLNGQWYNDGSPGGGQTGDIHAEISLRKEPEGLRGNWFVYRYTNASGTAGEVIGGGNFQTPISIGTSYTLYIEYDSINHRFIFRVGSEEITFGPTDLPPWAGNAYNPNKVLTTRVEINDASSSAFISATFDNVYKNGILYDDFSSSTIDPTKWGYGYYEYVREILGGKLRSKVRTSTGSAAAVYNLLEFVSPASINMIHSKVTPLIYQNSQGASLAAGLAGRFYNDGTAGGGSAGDVIAQILIGGTGINPTAEWWVTRYMDSAGQNTETLASGAFNTPIILGNTYNLFLGWNGAQLSFRIDDEEVLYTPLTAIHPPNIPWKGIGTRIFNPANREATIEAFFDDVMVSEVIKPGDCNGDGQTTIDEVQRGIIQFLDITAAEPCNDLNGDGHVTIDELQRIINAFLGMGP